VNHDASASKAGWNSATDKKLAGGMLTATDDVHIKITDQMQYSDTNTNLTDKEEVQNNWISKT
jgi:hypothetical protein